MPNSLHTNKIKDEKDAFVNELFNMIPKREELISGEASAIATQILKSVYLIATRDLSNLWLQFFLSQNQGFMRLFEKTVLK